MSESYHAVCPRCATTNRLPAGKPAEAAKCGHCGAPIFEFHPFELTAETFPRHVKNSDLPMVVDFWADWCGPCKMMAPIFAQAAGELEPKIRFGKVDTEAEPEIAGQFAVQSIPTLILFKGGREVARQSGALPLQSLKAWLARYM